MSACGTRAREMVRAVPTCVDIVHAPDPPRLRTYRARLATGATCTTELALPPDVTDAGGLRRQTLPERHPNATFDPSRSRGGSLDTPGRGTFGAVHGQDKPSPADR